MSEQVEIKHTGGVGAFFCAAILWILGLGAAAWLGFYTGFIQFHHEQTVEQRMDNRVGVTEPLTSAVKLKILPRHGCIRIEKAFLDGTKMTVYFRSHCDNYVDYYQFFAQGKAPDGTIVWSDYQNTAFLPRLGPGDRAEWSEDISQDARIATIEIWEDDTRD